MNPLVSVLSGFYNPSREHINNFFNSINSCSYNSIEFIIFNDGSDEICTKYIHENIQASNQKIKYIESKMNQGLTKALIICASAARGEFLARLDFDDQMSPGRISAQVDYLQSNQLIDLIGSNFFVLDSTGKTIGQTFLKFKSSQEIARNVMSLKQFFCHSSWMIRSRVYFEVGGYDGFYLKAQDYNLLHRLILHGIDIGCHPDPLVYLTKDLNSVSYDRNNTQLKYCLTSMNCFYKGDFSNQEEVYKRVSHLIYTTGFSKYFDSYKKIVALKYNFSGKNRLIVVTKHLFSDPISIVECFIYKIFRSFFISLISRAQ